MQCEKCDMDVKAKCASCSSKSDAGTATCVACGGAMADVCNGCEQAPTMDSCTCAAPEAVA